MTTEKQNARNIRLLIAEAEKAMNGDSNDSEHEALYNLVKELKAQGLGEAEAS